MIWPILYSTVAMIAAFTFGSIIGKHEARAQYGEKYEFVMQNADFITKIQLAEMKP